MKKGKNVCIPCPGGTTTRHVGAILPMQCESVDTNACLVHNCDILGGICIGDGDGYQCSCGDGWTGNGNICVQIGKYGPTTVIIVCSLVNMEIIYIISVLLDKCSQSGMHIEANKVF
jgi:hypothetical protein